MFALNLAREVRHHRGIDLPDPSIARALACHDPRTTVAHCREHRLDYRRILVRRRAAAGRAWRRVSR